MKPNALHAALIASTTVIGSTHLAQAHDCTLSDAAGRYGYTSNGTIVNPAVGPFTSVGNVTLTETGTFTGSQTTSVAGNLVEETVQGTFTVSPDCAGAATVARLSWDNAGPYQPAPHGLGQPPERVPRPLPYARNQHQYSSPENG
jgi:hypothetical protein